MRNYREMVAAESGRDDAQPIIAGKRIPVELILEKLAAGETVEQILDEHPRLTDDAVRTALAFAGALRADVVYPLETTPR